MSSRQYISFSVSEMGEFFQNNKSRETALDLLGELEYRSTSKAKKLQSKLQEFINGVGHSSSNATDIVNSTFSSLRQAGFGVDFPVSDYYKDKIVDARTLNNNGKWWTAVLVLSDPKTGKRFAKLYKWKNNKGGWKVRSSISLSNRKFIQDAINALSELKCKVD